MNAEQVKAIIALRRRDGRIMPADIVRAARSKNSVLHDEFTWDKDKASAKWWLQEARMLIARVEVLLETPDGEFSVRRFVALKSDSGGYRLTKDVVNDPTRAAALLAELGEELARLRERYRVFERLINRPELFEQLEQLIVRARPEARP